MFYATALFVPNYVCYFKKFKTNYLRYSQCVLFNAFIFKFAMSPMNTLKCVVYCHCTSDPPEKSFCTRKKNSNAFQISLLHFCAAQRNNEEITKQKCCILLHHPDGINVGLSSRNTVVSGWIGGKSKGIVEPEKAVVRKGSIMYVAVVHDDKCSDVKNY